jgi:glycosyltransferase involved in cell wall biosynthesis
MPKYLSAFDIACSPKIDCAENRAANPIKIYEYMLMGLPIVVSAVGEIAKVIESGVDGFLIKPGDDADLERTLEHVMQSLDRAREVGLKAREKVIKNYTQLVLRKRIEDALDSLVKRKPEIK